MPERKVLEPITGYCAPIVSQLEQVWSRKTLLGAQTGTLDALLSSENTAGRRMLNVFDERGKRLYTRLQFQNRHECPQDITVATGTGTAFEICNTSNNETVNRWSEYIINPDDLTYLTNGGNPWAFNLKYDYAEGEKICPEDAAQELAARMSEWMDNYAIKFNSVLYGLLCGAWTGHAASADPCDVGVLGGYGSGGWLDINGAAGVGTPTFTAMDQAGAVRPFFVSNWKKFLMTNGFSDTPIVVHGMGGFYDYAMFMANAASGYCCNDSGVNPAEIAGRIGAYNFMEGRPIANNNTGITQNDVLMWEPGVHQLIQPTDFKEPGQTISQYDHERRMIMHPSGLVFHMIRNLDKCDNKLQQNYTLYHRFKLYSKPTDVGNCNGADGTAALNQSVCASIGRCEPVACDGTTVDWGVPGDPTTDLNPA